MNVLRTSASPYTSVITPGTSPLMRTTTASTTELRRLVYQHRSSAESLRSLMAFLMTTAWKAVVALLMTPKRTPFAETLTPSRKTPTRKPRVTSAHARRIACEGRAERKKAEVRTVKGRTSPRATW